MKLKNIIIILLVTQFFHLYAEIPDSYPIKTKFNLIQTFGLKMNPFTGREMQYNEVKLSFFRETNIYPPGSGKIKKIINNKDSYNILIDHDYGFITELKDLENVFVQENDIVTKDTLLSKYSYKLDNIYGKSLLYSIKYKNTYINPEILILKDLSKKEKTNLKILTGEITKDFRNTLNSKDIVNLNSNEISLNKEFLINRKWGSSYFNDVGYQIDFFNNNTYIIYFAYQGYHGVMGTYEIINNQLVLNPKMNSPYLFWDEYNTQQILELTKNYLSLDSLIELKNINNETKFSDIHSPPDYKTIKEIDSIKIYNLERENISIISDSSVFISPLKSTNFYKFNINEIERETLPKNHIIIPIARSANKIDIEGKTEFVYYCKLRLIGWDHAIQEYNGQEVSVYEANGWILESNLNKDYILKVNTKYQ